MICSSLPAITASAAYITEANGAEFGYDNYGGTTGGMLHWAKYNGKKYAAFCLDFGAPSPSGTYTSTNDFIKYVKSDDEYQKVSRYIYLGYSAKWGETYPDNVSANWKKKGTAAYDMHQTQLLVWTELNGGKDPGTGFTLYSDFKKNIETLYDRYFGKNRNVSFHNSTISIGSTSKTVTDTNKVLQYYPTFDKTVNGVRFTHTYGSNNLTVTATANCNSSNVTFDTRTQEITQCNQYGKTISSSDNSWMYIKWKGSNKNIQNMMFSMRFDPTSFRLNVVPQTQLTVTKKVTFPYMTGTSDGDRTTWNYTAALLDTSSASNEQYMRRAVINFVNGQARFTVKYAATGKYVNVKSTSTAGSYTYSGTSNTATQFRLNSKGQFTISNLPVDKYTIQEVDVTPTVGNAAFANKKLSTNFDLASAQTVSTSAGKTSSVTMTNDFRYGNLRITKKFQSDGYNNGTAVTANSTVSNSNEYELSKRDLNYSARFRVKSLDWGGSLYVVAAKEADGIYTFRHFAKKNDTSASCDASMGNFDISNGSHAQAFKLSSSGTIVIRGLPAGNYQIEEADTNVYHNYANGGWKATGYKMSDVYTLASNSKVTVTASNTGSNPATSTATNKYMTGVGKVKKINEDGTKNYEGIQFTLSGRSYGGISVSKTATVGADGIADFGTLPCGKYDITETYIPPELEAMGYALSTSKQTITISKDKTNTVSFVNNAVTGTIQIQKEYSDGYEYSNGTSFATIETAAYSGITFTLSGKSDSGLDIEMTAVTDDTGLAVFDNVPTGTFTVTEDELPASIKNFTNLNTELINVESKANETTNYTCTNDVKSVPVKIKKVLSDGSTDAVSGITFRIMGNSDASHIYINDLITDENGETQTVYLPVGEGYFVMETSIPDEYKPFMSTSKKIIYVDITEEDAKAGAVKTFEFENTMLDGSVKVTKKNADGTKFVEGITFAINGTTKSGVEYSDTAVTNADGIALFESVPAGEFTVTELSLPDDIAEFEILNEDEKTVTVKSAQTSEIEFINQPKMGYGKIIKTTNDKNDFVAGITFNVKGTSYSGIEIDENFVTGEDGTVIGEFPAGEYTVTEVSMPESYYGFYKLNTNQQNVIITDGTTTNITFENEATVGKLSIKKVIGEADGFALTTDEEGDGIDAAIESMIESTSEEETTTEEVTDETTKSSEAVNPIENIEFIVESCDSGGNVGPTLSGAVFSEENGNAIHVFTDANGYAKVEESVVNGATLNGLPVGTYKITEVASSVPDGYLVAEPLIVEVKDYEEVGYTSVKFCNTPVALEFTKTDVATSETLPNCGIRIYKADDTENPIFEGFTDENGKIIFNELEEGKYYIQEFQAPDRYHIDESLIEFEVTSEGGVVKAEMKDKLMVGKIKIVKVDSADHDKVLENCEIAVYDEDMNEVFRGKTDENGVLITGDLPLGKYYYKELQVPNSKYVLDENTYEVVIEEHGQIVECIFENSLGKGRIIITKTDVSTGQTIPDCGIEILDENKNVIIQGRTDENGVVEFDELEVGKYYFREFDAPDGYYINEELFEFEITENGQTVKATMTDEAIPEETTTTEETPTNTPSQPSTPNTPHTGADSDVPLAVAAVTLLGGILVVYTIVNIRRRRKD